MTEMVFWSFFKNTFIKHNRNETIGIFHFSIFGGDFFGGGSQEANY